MRLYRHHFIAVLMVVVAVAVFWQVHDHTFVWDDGVNVYENPYLNPVTLPHVLRFWQEPYQRLYIPLSYTVWASVARFAKLPTTDESGANLNPRLFHVANLVLHLLSIMAVFAILRILVRSDWAACGGALLFALHPVQVEPVAWVTGMKDVLCGFLSLVAVWQYLAYAVRTPTSAEGTRGKGAMASVSKSETLDRNRRRLHYALATLAFVLALLAKPTAVVVPVVAWLLDYWLLRRSLRQSTVALGGWMALAVPFIVLTRLAQPEAAIHFVTPLWARPLVVGDAIAFYMYKLAIPLWLSPDYGRPPELVLRQWWGYLTWIVPCGLLVMAWLWRDRRPWLVASAGIFVVGVLPVSGLIPFSFQYVSTVADRYLYISMLAPALALAWFLSERRGKLVPVVCVLILGLLGITSAVQVQVWHDSERLWRHALAVTRESSSAHYNLAFVLDERGELEGAIEHYRQAVQIDPGATDAHNNLGNILAKRGELEEAIEHFQQVLRIDRADARAHYNLGSVLAKRGKLEEAIEHLRQAVQIDPAAADAHYNLGNILAKRGELEEAIKHYRQAVQINPADGDWQYKLGISLAARGELGEAIDHFQQALEINPDFAAAYHHLGMVVAAQGYLDKAIHFFRQALRIQPEFAEAHESLGQALDQQGKRDEAIKHYERALRIMKSRAAASTPR